MSFLPNFQSTNMHGLSQTRVLGNKVHWVHAASTALLIPHTQRELHVHLLHLRSSRRLTASTQNLKQ